MKSHDFAIPVPVRPVYIPGSGPPIAPLSLQPEDEDTDWMIWSVVQYKGLPQYQVCPKANHAHRRVVRKENVLDYVSQKAYEDFEYEEAKRREVERWEAENQFLAKAHKLQQKRAKNTLLIEKAAADKSHAKTMKNLDIEERRQYGETSEDRGGTKQESETAELDEVDLVPAVDYAKRKRSTDEDESEPKRQAAMDSHRRVSGNQASLSKPSLSHPYIIPFAIDSTATSDNDVDENDIEDGENPDDEDEPNEETASGDDNEAPHKKKTPLKRPNSPRRNEPTAKVGGVVNKSVLPNTRRAESPILPPWRPLAVRFPSKTPPKPIQPMGLGIGCKIPTPIPLPKRIFSSTGKTTDRLTPSKEKMLSTTGDRKRRKRRKRRRRKRR